MRLRPRTQQQPAPLAVSPDPDQAWKALSLVNDWVKHAETKLGVILGTTGVSGGVLYNLVKGQADANYAFNVAAAVCGAAVLAAGFSAMVGLYPNVGGRRRAANDTINPLFFHDVARAYKGDAPSYGAVLHTLTTNPHDLVQHLGQQIHANATIAQRKYRWANRAIRALLLDLLALGVVAVIVGLDL